jgi:uncharacterized protein (DUF488 family)
VATVATIGVYGATVDSFLSALQYARVELVLDVRQRRGVRGSEHAWANAQRLQAALAAAGIAYEHHKELAPTTELRQLQYREDDRLGVGKRARQVDLAPLVAELPEVSALLCVERDPEACHRSLIAGRLQRELGLRVVHVIP